MLRAITGTQAHQLRQQFSRQPLQRRSLSLLTKATALPQRSLNRPRLTPPIQAVPKACTITQFFNKHGHETTTSVQAEIDTLYQIHDDITHRDGLGAETAASRFQELETTSDAINHLTQKHAILDLQERISGLFEAQELSDRHINAESASSRDVGYQHLEIIIDQLAEKRDKKIQSFMS